MTERVAVRPGFLLPAAGGVAVLAAATAMTNMIAGAGWLLNLAGAAFAVVAVGALLRGFVPAARGPYAPPLLVLVQLFVLLCCCVTLFSPHAALGVLPGPDSVGDLGRLLGEAMHEIRTGRPPVPATAAMRCLITAAVGVVAVLVDLLVVDVRMPAVAGLLLLGVYAVPASLADEMLPWWAFGLGAIAFALLLAADRARRRQEWRGSVGLAGHRGLRVNTTMTAVTGIALVCALVAGATVTAIGTTGNLPGQQEGTRSVNGSWGLNPFTKLQGELNEPDQTVELFRVRGPASGNSYLRAVTLSQFDPKVGWRVGTVGSGQPLEGELQRPPGARQATQSSRIQIEPVNWRDNWLPLFGVPGQVSGVDSRKWRWDPALSAAFARTPTDPHTYTEQARLQVPTARELRSAPAGTEGLPNPQQYTDLPKVDPRVSGLARKLTGPEPTTFDKARAVWSYLTSSRFTYSLQTKPQVLRDPLADFLFHGKQGFCEQFASAMGVMLRAVGIPARVDVGFTPGTEQDGYREITTQDAHAWVEVYFPGYGWMTFDPTPLTDGRGITPDYLRKPQGADTTDRTGGPTASSRTSSVPPPPDEQSGGDRRAAAAVPPAREDDWWPPLAQAFTLAAPAGAVWTLLGLVVAGASAAAVLLARRRRDRRRGRHAR